MLESIFGWRSKRKVTIDDIVEELQNKDYHKVRDLYYSYIEANGLIVDRKEVQRIQAALPVRMWLDDSVWTNFLETAQVKLDPLDLYDRMDGELNYCQRRAMERLCGETALIQIIEQRLDRLKQVFNYMGDLDCSEIFTKVRYRARRQLIDQIDIAKVLSNVTFQDIVDNIGKLRYKFGSKRASWLMLLRTCRDEKELEQLAEAALRYLDNRSWVGGCEGCPSEFNPGLYGQLCYEFLEDILLFGDEQPEMKANVPAAAEKVVDNCSAMILIQNYDYLVSQGVEVSLRKLARSIDGDQLLDNWQFFVGHGMKVDDKLQLVWPS